MWSSPSIHIHHSWYHFIRICFFVEVFLFEKFEYKKATFGQNSTRKSVAPWSKSRLYHNVCCELWRRRRVYNHIPSHRALSSSNLKIEIWILPKKKIICWGLMVHWSFSATGNAFLRHIGDVLCLLIKTIKQPKWIALSKEQIDEGESSYELEME